MGDDGEDGKSGQSAFDAGDSAGESKLRSAGLSRPVAPVSTPSQPSHQPGGPTPRVLSMAKVIEVSCMAILLLVLNLES